MFLSMCLFICYLLPAAGKRLQGLPCHLGRVQNPQQGVQHPEDPQTFLLLNKSVTEFPH
jgi:hypothetical protein